MKNKKAFTLVELIVVLVILAIVALIVTPIVLGILKNAENRARERSVDGYGKAIETAFFDYELSHGNTTTDLSKLDVKYSGDKVTCDEVTIRENGGVYLSNCSVAGVVVKDSTSKDGFYHYGISNREYIKKYAIALESQIVSYAETNSKIPDVSTLTNEYSKTVSCNQVQVNYNNSVYLSECSVGGTEEKDETTEDGYYHYGYLQDYKVGDKITFNGTEFYVIADSGLNQEYVTLLKAEPLTVEQVSKYGEGHINNYTYSSVKEPYKYGNNYNGDSYGGVAYYSSSTCGYSTAGASKANNNCPNSYNDDIYSGSDIKYIVDAWTKNEIKFSNLKFIEGFASRLITLDELYELGCTSSGCNSSKYKWTYSSSAAFGADNSENLFYNYWTMTSKTSISSSQISVAAIDYGGYLYYRDYYYYKNGVRPVINLYKKAM